MTDPDTAVDSRAGCTEQAGASDTQLAAQLGQLLMAKRLTMTTVESCTGGLVAGALTAVPGSSAWFETGLVTYSNAAKRRLVGVPAQILDAHGAVSEACVLAMAQGALRESGADVAVAVSGIAGPDGATPGKPVGTVWLAWALGEQMSAEVFTFAGNRQAVREQAVEMALRGTIFRIETN